MDISKKELSLEEYKEIYNLLPVGLYRTSLKDGTFLNANLCCAKLLGFKSPDDLIGKVKSSSFYASPSDRKKFISLLQEGIVENFELELALHDDTTIWVAITGRISKDGYIEGSLMDITDRKILEEELNTYKAKECQTLELITEEAQRRSMRLKKN